MENTTNTMKCNMCLDGDMEYTEFRGTHIYSCENCPNIQVEFYQQNDAENLQAYLQGKPNYEKLNDAYELVQAIADEAHGKYLLEKPNDGYLAIEISENNLLMEFFKHLENAEAFLAVQYEGLDELKAYDASY